MEYRKQIGFYLAANHTQFNTSIKMCNIMVGKLPKIRKYPSAEEAFTKFKVPGCQHPLFVDLYKWRQEMAKIKKQMRKSIMRDSTLEEISIVKPIRLKSNHKSVGLLDLLKKDAIAKLRAEEVIQIIRRHDELNYEMLNNKVDHFFGENVDWEHELAEAMKPNSILPSSDQLNVRHLTEKRIKSERHQPNITITFQNDVEFLDLGFE